MCAEKTVKKLSVRPKTIQDQALESIRELLSTHRCEAKDAANEDGKFAIGLCITVQDGAPARLKVKCSISKKVTDEIESQIEDFDSMKLSL
jgi:excinuclease UvrABC nuclease subunit